VEEVGRRVGSRLWVGEDNPAEEDNRQEGNPVVADMRQADSLVAEGSPVGEESLAGADSRPEGNPAEEDNRQADSLAAEGSPVEADIPAAEGGSRTAAVGSRAAVPDIQAVGEDNPVAEADTRVVAADDNPPVAAALRRTSYRTWRRTCFRG
jgi:hypothetical protein